MSKQNCQSLFIYQSFTINLEKLNLYIITVAESIIHLTFLEAHHILAQKKLARAAIPKTADSNEPPDWLLTPIQQYVKGTITTLPFQTNNYLLGRGTSFQKKVWQQISAIPVGTTRTYGELARLVGSPGASRAVGHACHVNPFALIIPCHRVVGQKDMGGFAGGADTKRFLLAQENV